MKRAILFGLLFLVGVLAVPVATQQVDPQITIAINNLITGVTSFTRARFIANGYINWGSGTDNAGYGLRDSGGSIQVKNSGGAWAPIIGSGGNPLNSSYWTRVADGTLTNETALGTLATGFVINTNLSGVPTIYAGANCTNQFLYALSASGAASCDSVFLSTDVTGTLAVANGGTGLTAGTSGGVLAYTAAGTLASSGALTANRIVMGGGAGAVPTVLGSLGTTSTVLHGNAGGAPTFAAVTLTTDVAGILPTANGGTNNAFIAWSGPATSIKTYTLPNVTSTILTSNAAVTPAQGGTGLSSYTTGQILYASAATTIAGLSDVATGNAIISGGVGIAPSYGKIGLTTHVSGTLPATNGGTGLALYAIGDLPYATTTTSLGRLAAVAVGQVLISTGVSTAPAWSATPRMTSISLGSANLTFSGTAPTISSGFGTGAAVTGTAAAFRIDVGTGGTATDGVVGLPTAATGWNCHVENLTGTLGNVMDQRTVQVSSTTATATIENQTVTTGAALAWTASDIVAGTCVAY